LIREWSNPQARIYDFCAVVDEPLSTLAYTNTNDNITNTFASTNKQTNKQK